MALEEEDKNEEITVAAKTEEVAVDSSVKDLLVKLQERIAELESSKAAPAPGTDVNEALMKQIATLVTQNKPVAKGQFNFDNHYSEEDIDEDDVLSKEEMVTFMTHKMMYIIVDDKRNGKNVRVPFDKILFKYSSTRTIKRGKETEIIQLSQYTCRSKKELAWLRSHSYFNITFFDKIDVAISTDVRRAGRLAKLMLTLSGMNHHALIAMAQERGIAVGQADMNQMRGLIATKLVDIDDEQAATRMKSSMMEQKLEADLIEKTVN